MAGDAKGSLFSHPGVFPLSYLLLIATNLNSSFKKHLFPNAPPFYIQNTYVSFVNAVASPTFLGFLSSSENPAGYKEVREAAAACFYSSPLLHQAPFTSLTMLLKPSF